MSIPTNVIGTNGLELGGIINGSDFLRMLTKKTYDVVVMGGGVVGSSIAYHLTTMGCKNVAVVERDNGYKHASAVLSVN